MNTPKSEIAPKSQASLLFDRIATILDTAQQKVLRAVNSEIVLAYWLIGREIVTVLQSGTERAAYGKSVIAELSQRLGQYYGRGYSPTNLWYFRQFYLSYATGCNPDLMSAPTRDGSILHPAGGELAPYFHPNLSWSHYRSLMRIEKLEARQFYENEAVRANWSKRDLERQISSQFYERLISSKLSAEEKQVMLEQACQDRTNVAKMDVLKDPYVLEFLDLPNTACLQESQLEQAIIDKLQQFLLELGRGFSFVARQKRMRFGDKDFYIDLVFYNYLLKCFVLIDLKIGELTHQDIGQMDSYVRMVEEHEKVAGDNPTIGLILCSEKNEAVARYSVLHESEQLFASKYRFTLPTEDELQREIARERAFIENQSN